jgi:uncharacterized protein YkwD
MTKIKHINFYLLIISGLTFVLSFSVFIYFLSINTPASKDAEASAYSKDQIIVAVNLERKKAGLPELIKNSKLEKASQAKAQHMADNKYFSHVHKESGKRWSDFIKEADYDYAVAGENLANGFYNVSDMVKAWMDSPTHKENILNDAVDETAIGIAYGELDGAPTIFVVQEFGKQ